MENRLSRLTEFIRKKVGFAPYSDLIKAGFYKAIIGEALNAGQIERISRGIYGLCEPPDVSHPDFVTVSAVVPKGVICLISALSFHEVTDEIPHYTDVAIPAQSRAKEIRNLPVRFYRFSRKTWQAGIEEHHIGGCTIRVYSLAKTIADCFKFRNQIGTDVARKALKTAFEEKKATHLEIIKYFSIFQLT